LLAAGIVRPASTDYELKPKFVTKSPTQPAGGGDENVQPKGVPGPNKADGFGPPVPPPPPAGLLPSLPSEPVGTPAFDFNKSVKQTGEDVQRVVQEEWVSMLNEAEASVAPGFAHWPAVRAGTFLLAGLLVGVMYLRMVGAGRRAIREWLDYHQPTT
jgi:hypothetical protein